MYLLIINRELLGSFDQLINIGMKMFSGKRHLKSLWIIGKIET